MKEIYVFFSYTGTYFASILRLFDGEKYIHVSICLDGNLKKVYSFGRKNPRWMFPNGFVIEDMDLVTRFFNDAICKIYKLSITKNEYRNLKKELKKYQNKASEYHYNLKGLVHIKFNKIYHRPRHFVCSQFVGKILQDSKIYNFKKDYSILKPRDIESIPNLELIYEGKIIDRFKKLDV